MRRQRRTWRSGTCVRMSRWRRTEQTTGIARVSMAKRTFCLLGMFEGLFPHSGAQPCRDRVLPSKGGDPRSWSGSGGCAEPLWLEPHLGSPWDFGASCPCMGLTGEQGWAPGSPGVLQCVGHSLGGLTPSVLSSNPLPACRSAPLSLSLCPGLGSLTKPFTSSRTPISLATCMCSLQTISCPTGSGGPAPALPASQGKGGCWEGLGSGEVPEGG